MSIELKQAAQDAAEAIDWLLNNIRRDAPQLSGKAMGNAEKCASALRTALAQQPATGEPVGYMNEGHIHELAMRRIPYGYVYPEAGAGASTAVYTHPAPSVLKDDQIAALVNKVRDIARMFHDHQSLRERIAVELVPVLKASQEVKSNAERWRYAIADGGNQSMNFIDIFGDWDGDGDFVEVFDAARLAAKEPT